MNTGNPITDAASEISLITALRIAQKAYEKYKSFLEGIAVEKIEAFFREAAKDEHFAQKLKDLRLHEDVKEFERKVLDTVNQLDSVEKCQILGYVFDAMLNKKISSSEYARIQFMVNRTYIDDLEFLYRKFRYDPFAPQSPLMKFSQKEADHTKSQLAAIGFLIAIPIPGENQIGQITYKQLGRLTNSLYNYDLTIVGEKFLRYGLCWHYVHFEKEGIKYGKIEPIDEPS